MTASSNITQSSISERIAEQQTKPMRLALLLSKPDVDSVNEHFIAIDTQRVDGFELALLHSVETLSSTRNDMVNIGDRLWIMPGLIAAKHGVHAHAYINGIAVGDNQVEAVTLALAHAKRLHAQPQIVALDGSLDVSANVSTTSSADANAGTHASTHAQTTLTAMVTLVESIASRCIPSKDNSNSQYWFSTLHQSRVAALCYPAAAGVQAMILTQGRALIAAKALINTQRLWLPLCAASLTQLRTKLMDFSTQLNSTADDLSLLKLINTTLVDYQTDAPLALVLMAADRSGLVQEVNAMMSKMSANGDLAQSSNAAIEYKTPAGSCFYSAPLGHHGLSFVYPGVGTVYPNMLSQLGLVFPDLYAELENQGDMQSMLQTEYLYGADNSRAAQMSLSQLAIAGVGASYVLTKLLQQEFAIEPRFALGYSMGEAAMWASLNVWQAPHRMIAATQNSSIFSQDISGELRCVRQQWQLADDETIVWNSFVTRASIDELTPHLADHPRAYIAIIQGDTCVIAGCESSCKALLKQAGKRGIAANRVTAMHTPAALNITTSVSQFYQQPLVENLPHQLQFISAAEADPVALTSHAIAQSIADTFCHQLDFTQLIHKARHHGCRLFVEVGADRQITTLIDKINAQSSDSSPAKVHAKVNAMAVNAKGGDDISSLLKCLGQLITHRVPMSLSPFIRSLNDTINTLSQQAALADGSSLIRNSETSLEGEPH
ncbi:MULTISPECIES: PfaB family protein [Shewanella]|uniref:PfaB family protein n=1 Tax=Shewanella psychromarinicola TaxID=2487742 RepID=A0A3N4ED94_9GAMM|nr:PfaB family protein [Shewanella psychromarinicola]AZG36951.1 PfaB family protein [Shewanella psychromarinicola]MCL1082477.1 PfaB family protein [Shewanella psychromarinicola]RPA34806.1 PfaB family protein [Shewanella psychromarinicola]